MVFYLSELYSGGGLLRVIEIVIDTSKQMLNKLDDNGLWVLNGNALIVCLCLIAESSPIARLGGR